MNTKKIILVTGATGAQGGSVVKHLLNQGKFEVRAMTRDASSLKAKALEAAGATVVEADMDNITSLKKVMEGCYGLFGVTNFWEHFEKEYEHGMNLIKAVSKSNIQHFVFSTLPNASLITKGRLPVPHFDLKAEMEQAARNLNLNATFLHVAFYYENFIHFTPLQKNDDNAFYFGFPQGDTKLSAVGSEDIGGVVATVFSRPMEFIGRILGVVGEDITCDQYAAIMSKLFNKKVEYKHIPHEVFASSDFPAAEEIANMFEFNRFYIHNRQQDLDESRKLYPGIQGFESWLKNNLAKFDNIVSHQPEENFV